MDWPPKQTAITTASGRVSRANPYALGSEGRQEQTLASDQDNGLIFAGSGDAVAVREQLLPMALRINEALDACGFPLCTGQVMASNPQWCLDLHEWRQRFAGWIIEGDPQALLNASIFFDLRPGPIASTAAVDRKPLQLTPSTAPDNQALM
jgi:signal-transduction protein with cAMP-binding, CBS, and nucleotidyltransferase domain